MQKLITIIALLFFSAQTMYAQQNNATTKVDGPQITFKEDVHDFGNIKEGVIAEYSFSFTNTGNKPLMITEVRPSCGCTTPEYSKEPIAPGKTGVIKVAYNSQNRPGNFMKSITITTNEQGKAKVLFIKGDVIKAPNSNMMEDPNQSPVRLNNG